MHRFVLLGLLGLISCAPRYQTGQAGTLLVGGCYYYHRPGPGGLFAEKVNPFWFRLLDRSGRIVLMDVWAADGSREQLWQGEKQLTRYSVSVPCTTLDSLGQSLANHQ